MKSYDLYIFDLDDTLLDTFRTVAHKHYSKLAEMLGRDPPTLEAVRSNWHRPLEDSLRGIFGDAIDAGQAVRMLAELHDRWPISAQPDTDRILHALHRHGKGVAVFSSCSPEILHKSIENSLPGGTSATDVLYSTVTEGTAKPSPSIIQQIRARYEHLRQTKVAKEQIVTLGDSLADFYTARDAGVDFVAVASGVNATGDFVEAGLKPDCVYPSIGEAIVPPDSHGIVAIIRNPKDEVLLLREARTDNPYYGYWSGPHGRCKPSDVIEEETVTREVREECGIEVRPTREVYTRTADTKVKTVSFWLAEPCDSTEAPRSASHETDNIAWVPVETIMAGRVPLYPGTEDFFVNHYH